MPTTAQSTDDPRRFLDPLTLAKIRGLELQARMMVEGYISGMHKSPYNGFSVEFAQHREYVPGDDIKHIDWKVYGRTGRFFLKQYEEETNLICWIILDVSESMKYGSTEITKFQYASMAAAGLAYLVLHQSDSVGFAAFDNQIRTFIKPSGQPSRLKEITHHMVPGPGQQKSRMGPLFHDLAERLTRKSLVFVISDMFDEVPEVIAGLKHLRHRKHEVILWHTMDAAELTFPFQEATLFRGLEQYPDLLTDPRSMRKGYMEQVELFVEGLRRGCRDLNIDYLQLQTDTPLNVALSSYLAHRKMRAK